MEKTFLSFGSTNFEKKIKDFQTLERPEHSFSNFFNESLQNILHILNIIFHFYCINLQYSDA